MRKGICVGSLPGGISDEGLALAKRAGFDGVEPGSLTDGKARRRAADLAQAHGLAITSVMHSVHWAKPLSDPDPCIRRGSVDGMAEAFDTAAATGTDTVLLVPAVVNKNVSYEEAWIRSQAEILELLSDAAARGMVIAIENVWNKFLLSPIEFARYIDQFNSPHLRAYFDVGNIALYGFPHQWIRTLGARIVRVHVKGFDTKTRQFTPTLLGGDLDWGEATSALADIGYDGWVTAEMPQDNDDPVGGTMRLGEEMDRILSGSD